ncbi:cysteine-rich receptor-like protein kinase 25 isoform X1 [Pyrus x bretschneideri]|uniref:cysteine-rich receptor-like protein kinase 25 isoform X1 n=3 Tax=Pyrus x bretschneideri TaxID=225117 RepID=UPI000870A93D|nr:cysteine-rich receptor-like protein kinase 25 isoform X1 [Pyrus x bretschneideri]
MIRDQNMANFPSVPKTISLFLLCYLITFLFDLAYADPPYKLCSDVRGYVENSTFQKNLQSLLNSLPSNASVSKLYNTSAGNEPDRVYGLYMCLDYVTNETCHNCINTAHLDIVRICPNSTESVVWEETCQLRYSDVKFYGELNMADNIALANKENVSDPIKFEYTVREKLSELAKRAAYNVSAKMYATGDVQFEDKVIYALVQCTRDLSGDDCDKCLQHAIEDVLREFYFSIGARLLSRSCYLRYELYAFYNGATEASISSSPNNNKGDGRGWWITILTVVSACLAILLLGSCFYLAMRKRNKKVSSEILRQHVLFPEQRFQGRNPKAEEYPYISLASIHAATDKFSDSNKLGEGGFGPVYKGVLSDGKEVAIKRLSSCSEQGSEEFTTEVLLIMKLQHKNLVRLLGFCVEGEEKLLVYEYLPNSSLNVFLFDSEKRAQLDWSRRVNIVSGIARGILYLHEDSRLQIIHRDLKASNVLLDSDMNPKISDFGMARIFAGSEGQANTTTIVGTYGYMAPEYAMEGVYSVKSDVYGFGVLLLEIITGRRNASFHPIKRVPSLVTYAWKLWHDGKGLELLDPLLLDSCDPHEFLRYLHIGLLCVQEDAYDRPTMSSAVVMLKSETVTLSQPEKPAFTTGRFTDHYTETAAGNSSINGLTVSNVMPR